WTVEKATRGPTGRLPRRLGAGGSAPQAARHPEEDRRGGDERGDGAERAAALDAPVPDRRDECERGHGHQATEVGVAGTVARVGERGDAGAADEEQRQLGGPVERLERG